MTDTHISQNALEQQGSIDTEKVTTQNVSNDYNEGSIVKNVASDSILDVSQTSQNSAKKVDIVLAGITYPIYCPVDEEPELRSAVYELNNFMLDLKKQAPNQSQENILVLCCLDLYEKITAQKRIESKRLEQSKQTDEMLNKIIKDAQSIR